MSFGKRLGIIFLALVAAHVVSRSTGYTEDFYKGKTIRIVVATTPGGGIEIACEHWRQWISGADKNLAMRRTRIVR
jgi:hypothetical protein